MSKKQLLLLALLATLLVALLQSPLAELLTLEGFKANREALQLRVESHLGLASLVFFATYVVAVAFSIPGAAVLTLAGGALFGLGLGAVLVSFASTVGATLAFLASRYVLRDSIEQKFGARLAPIQAGLEKDGLFYLATLRLMPIFPFWLINLLMGLTKIKTLPFALVSQLGMLPGTLIFVNAGTQLANVNALSDILTTELLGSLLLLGVFPLLVKRALNRREVQSRYRGAKPPKHFDRNLVVIGAGAGGLVSSLIGATVKAKVTLIEAHEMGGDCLNTGCVPSKALIRAAKNAQEQRKAASFGITPSKPQVDFPALMARIQQVIADIAPHDSVERYTGLGVEVLQGYGRLIDPWTVEVKLASGQVQRLTAKSIIIAAGAGPFVPDLPGLRDVALTSDSLWKLPAQPRRLVVMGGGPIGCEISQSFARLGTEVHLVEMADRLLSREEPEASAVVQASLAEDGVHLHLKHQALRVVDSEGSGKALEVKASDGSTALVPFDVLLCAVGRKARTTGYGLEELGIAISPRGTVETNGFLQTSLPHIFAVGDVTGPYQLTHAAAHMAWTAAVNGLFGRFKKFKIDYRVLPWATFTDPEVARVGVSVAEATAAGLQFEVHRYGLDDLDRAIADGTTRGFIQVITPPGKDKILGVTIVGAHAGDLIAEYALAMRNNLGLGKILATVHPYPTLAESSRFIAGIWKKEHAPQWAMPLLERYHRWERS